jgi:hypothetical protein
MASISNIRRHPRVAIVDDERGIGNGVIVTLKKGWTFSRGEDNRVRGEDSVFTIYDAVKHEAYRHDGPFDD